MGPAPAGYRPCVDASLTSHTDGVPPGDPGGSAYDEGFLAALTEVVAALSAGPNPFGIIGGVASAAYGRPRCTSDIDVFCRPDDAVAVLDTLAGSSFEVEQTNPAWIYKARRHGVVVDVIFKTKGEIYFDDAMRERVRSGTFEGIEVPLVSPEDVMVMKAITADETSPTHWWDALCIISLNDLDWDYVLDRARKGPNRVASLLHFALSVDLPVPTSVVGRLDGLITGTLGT